MADYLDELNEQQKQAVLHDRGPLLVVAGAGTGKTKTITYRIYHLIQTGVDPRNILAITFTNKAASEMKERVMALHSKNDVAPFISTFHALGVFLLRNHAERLKLSKYFSIADTTDQRALIKEAMKALDIDPKRWEPKKIRSIISRKKGDLFTADELARDAKSATDEIVAMVWQKYEELLRENSALDFDDLLLKSYQLLRDHEDIRKHYQKLWQHIHIDEYQDTNTVQYKMSRLLADAHNNICVVGDGDQNIYSWRGADMRNILNFERDYKNARVVMLEKNYRSTKNILAAADEVISKNTARVPKTLVTDNPGGDMIKRYKAFSGTDEAYFIAKEAARLLARGTQAREIAVLFRTNFQSRVLEEAFLNAGIPYQVLGVKFFDRKEVKDLLSYLRAALNNQSLADVKRTINNPKRGIGPATVAKIFAGQKDTLPTKTKLKYEDYLNTLGKIEEMIHTKKPSETIKFAIEVSGFGRELAQGTEEDAERLANMKELVTYATRYDLMEPEEGVQKLLEDAALMGEQDSLNTEGNKKNAVRLMTIHASKGLEFDYVFVTGLEQGLFPSEREHEKKEDAEEERRLMYVAITRAKKGLFLSYAQIRNIYGEQQVQMPSEFLDDIPEHLVQEMSGDGGEPVKTIYLDF